MQTYTHKHTCAQESGIFLSLTLYLSFSLTLQAWHDDIWHYTDRPIHEDHLLSPENTCNRQVAIEEPLKSQHHCTVWRGSSVPWLWGSHKEERNGQQGRESIPSSLGDFVFLCFCSVLDDLSSSPRYADLSHASSITYSLCRKSYNTFCQNCHWLQSRHTKARVSS
mgnify:CR=1 FL=1